MNLPRFVLKTWYCLPIIAIIAGVLLFVACAKQASPEGGPYDMAPPRFIKSTPVAGAVNVKKRTIKLRFDENVKLERQSEKVVFTPPQLLPPKITAGVGKTITIKYEQPFIDSTTYVIDFADAIVDLNEGNPLEGFSFAFSTGATIDSMVISGKVIDAETLMPLPNLTVGIYKHFIPEDLSSKAMLRITRTTNEGNFTITHVAPGKYKLFAINDIDRSYNYTGASEGIAFLNEEVEAVLPKKEQQTSIDSVPQKQGNDSIANIVPKANANTSNSFSMAGNNDIPSANTVNADTVQNQLTDSAGIVGQSIPDSINGETTNSENSNELRFETFTPRQPIPDHLLLYSKKKRGNIALQRASRPDSAQIKLVFTAPIDSLPILSLITPQTKLAKEPKMELGDSRTEVTFWITDSTLHNRDSLQYRINYWASDSLMNLVPKTDTLTLVHKKKSSLQNKRTKSIFQLLIEKNREKKRKKHIADSLQIAKLKGQIPDSIPSDSIPATDSIAKTPPLIVSLVAQAPLRKGFPGEPLYIELSQVPQNIDTTRMHLYYITVDSAKLQQQNEQIPSITAQDSTANINQSQAEANEKNQQAREDAFRGGATNPYESGVERYNNPENNSPTTPNNNIQQGNNNEKISIPEGEKTEVPFTLSPNALHARRYRLNFEQKFNSYYMLKIDSAAIIGAYGAINESTELGIKSEAETNFGSLLIVVDSLLHSSPAYMELLTEADSVLERKHIIDSVIFSNITPGTYYTRIWFDRNNNGTWDEAIYPSQKAEYTYYYPKSIEVKPKFTTKVGWRLNALPLYEQRPESMKKAENDTKQEQRRERHNLNEEYIARMRERHGEKWNPTDRDRRMLGMPSRKEERKSKKEANDTNEQTETQKEPPRESPVQEEKTEN